MQWEQAGHRERMRWKIIQALLEVINTSKGGTSRRNSERRKNASRLVKRGAKERKYGKTQRSTNIPVGRTKSEKVIQVRVSYSRRSGQAADHVNDSDGDVPYG